MSRLCNFRNCEKKHWGKGYCRKHYEQYRTHKMCISLKDRSISIEQGIVTISSPLMLKNIIIDEGTYKEINTDIWWYDSKRDLVFGMINGHSTQLKDLVFGKKGSDVVIRNLNGNGADCRKHNLYELKRYKVYQTKSLSVNNTSGFRGVSWSKYKQRWLAKLRVNNELFTETRKTFEEAVEARKLLEKKHWDT
jgi:hypothetical protein